MDTKIDLRKIQTRYLDRLQWPMKHCAFVHVQQTNKITVPTVLPYMYDVHFQQTKTNKQKKSAQVQWHHTNLV